MWIENVLVKVAEGLLYWVSLVLTYFRVHF